MWVKLTAVVEHGDVVVEIGPALIPFLVGGELVLKSDLDSDSLTWSQQNVLRILSRIEKSIKLNFKVDTFLVNDSLVDGGLNNFAVLCFISHIWIVIIKVISWLQSVVAEAIDTLPSTLGIFIFEAIFQADPVSI